RNCGGYRGLFRRSDHRGGRRTMGSAGEPCLWAGLERYRSHVRNPRSGGCDTDPERWRVRGRSKRADLDGAYARSIYRPAQDLLSDRMRLRLPNVAFQIGSWTLPGAVGNLPTPPRHDVATDSLSD